MSSGPLVLENTTKRDALIAIEKKYQAEWQENRVFELDAPFDPKDAETEGDALRAENPKYFASFAYPYMNGVLHIGHGFTLSKVEFATGFERMNFAAGATPRRALFPIGFHCSGMPIRASADKIAREVEMFGPDFAGYSAEQEEEPAKEQKKVVSEDVTKFKAGKAKAVQKAGKAKYQFQIMEQSGIPKDIIHKFADPLYWLEYFPALCQRDVSLFGLRVDWRRLMITTDQNPFYDLFVRWHTLKMRDLGKIKFGERYTIYSEKDGQACMDHDRQSGEGVGPQEYTGIKIELLEVPQGVQLILDSANFSADGKKIYLVAATLRPETMYGQTCCFVSPKIQYGLFDAGNNEYFVCTRRAFKNMSYQKITPQRGVHTPVAIIPGSELIGARIHAPMSVYSELRVLPMQLILEGKGTGVVTCVPSDLPDDYVMMQDLRNKPEFYGIEKLWAEKEVVPVLETKKYGAITAEAVVKALKIQLPKDVVELAKAKEMAYKEGYFNGTMLVGKYKGMRVQDAKPKVKADMVASGDAFVYNEPESLVMLRSGDECIVSLEDQWYIDYGEENWKARALEALHLMQTFSPEVEHAFEGVLDWLKNWALTRTYGLGTKLPWDESQLVESLSDLTIYQAYYTVLHLLHPDYYGREQGPLGIKPEQMTPEVWEYIFLRKEIKDTTIDKEALDRLRREFEYFYPLDMSVSGKDLIPNHLTFFIYTNVAIFHKKHWPAGIRANGHLLLNKAKMSKLTGNFYTLKQIVEKFGADAARIALADAGDSVEDANFDEKNASAAILRLYTLKEWAEDVVKRKSEFRSEKGNSEVEFFDKAFDNEMNRLVEECRQQFIETNYKFALKAGLFDFMAARDYYIDTIGLENAHIGLLTRYIKTQALLLAPIAPHFAEYLYKEVLGEKGTVHLTAFPRAEAEFDTGIAAGLEYVKTLSRAIREAEMAALKPKKGKKVLDVNAPTRVTLYVALTYPEWQDRYLEVVRVLFEEQKLSDNKEIKTRVEGKDMKKAMPYISGLKARLQKESPEVVFNRKLGFDELEVLKMCWDIFTRCTMKVKVGELKVVSFKSGATEGEDVTNGGSVEVPGGKITETAVPGAPAIVIENISSCSS